MRHTTQVSPFTLEVDLSGYKTILLLEGDEA